MNAEELQQRLDAVAAPHGAASEDEWTRNRELVGARRRRRRVGGGVAAGLAAAAAVVVAVTWNPAANPLSVQPAGPVRAQAVDPSTLNPLAEECAQTRGVHVGVTALAGATSGLGRGVLYRVTDGGIRSCVFLDGGTIDGPLADDLPIGQAVVGWVGVEAADPAVGSMYGRRGSDYARVVVSTPNGQEYEAAFVDQYWWTPVSVAQATELDDTTWAAFDQQGRLVDQGRAPTTVRG